MSITHTPAAFFLDFLPCPVGIFTTQANWSVIIALRMSPFEDSIIWSRISFGGLFPEVGELNSLSSILFNAGFM